MRITINRFKRDIKKLSKLNRVDLAGLKLLTDLTPLLQARKLKQLVVSKCPQVSAKMFQPLRKHHSLKEVEVAARPKDREAIRQMFPRNRVRPYRPEAPM
jgi:hypothetical protein